MKVLPLLRPHGALLGGVVRWLAGYMSFDLFLSANASPLDYFLRRSETNWCVKYLKTELV